ncbi:hypothetical protein VZT92_006600 [Zoarces viviparus]|uniref:Uncharacterized protein n=1 Tax=Zoarces viviparus TaxID=48416 RepID=A0AAW1FPZ6_ZOAVI
MCQQRDGGTVADLVLGRASLLQTARCQALMGNNGCSGIAAAGCARWGLGVKVLGSHLPTAPCILGQIHTAQGEHIWREHGEQ